MMYFNYHIFLTEKADEQLREIVRSEVEQAGSVDAGLELLHEFAYEFKQMKRYGRAQWWEVFDYPILFHVLGYYLITKRQYLMFCRFDESCCDSIIVYAIVDERRDYRISHRSALLDIPTWMK